MSDELQRRLSSLRADLDGVALASPRDVRRRGDRRTRNQLAGGAIASVAALGLVGTLALSALGAETDDNRPIVAATPTASDTASPATAAPTPSETSTPKATATTAPPATQGAPDPSTEQTPPATPQTTDEEPGSPGLIEALADDPLLTGADLGEFPVYGALQRSPDDPSVAPLCATNPALFDAAERASGLFFDANIGEATVSEWVLRFGTVAEAESAVKQLQDELAGCEDQADPADVTLDVDGPTAVDVGDQAFRYAVKTTPVADGGLGFDEVATVRQANVVVVAYWNAMGDPYNGSRAVFGTPVLQKALDAAVG
jgi:hypothetical protein